MNGRRLATKSSPFDRLKVERDARWLAWVLPALMLGCAAEPLPAKLWPAEAFKKRGADFGGFASSSLAALAGEPIPFRSPPFEAAEVKQAGPFGLVPRLAVAGGQSSTYVVTDLWSNHPSPWVQPIYRAVSEFDPAAPISRALPGTRAIFPVDSKSSFYSPYWRRELAVVPANTPDAALQSASTLLAAAKSVHTDIWVLCPVVPKETALARPEGEPPRRPVTGEALEDLKADTGWFDGKDVHYVDFGGGRFREDERALPIERLAYFFVTADRKETVLPAVLPDAPEKNSFLRRVDVVLAPKFSIFVPATMPELRAAMEKLGATVPAVDPMIPAATQSKYALRVATDASCFSDTTRFPAGCRFLDTQTNLEADVGAAFRLRTETLMTIGVLKVAP